MRSSSRAQGLNMANPHLICKLGASGDMTSHNGANAIGATASHGAAEMMTNVSSLEESPFMLASRIDALNMRVTELLLEQTRELSEHTEALAAEVGMLRERAVNQDERIAELRQDRETLRGDAAWLQETLRSLEDEVESLHTSDTIRRTRVATVATVSAIFILASSIIALVIWFASLQ